MTILGTVAVIIVAIAVSLFLGPYGTLVLIAATFGLSLSTYMRNKEIHSDLQRIKERLGIEDKDDFRMSNEEIEAELEKELVVIDDEQEGKK